MLVATQLPPQSLFEIGNHWKLNCMNIAGHISFNEASMHHNRTILEL